MTARSSNMSFTSSREFVEGTMSTPQGRTSDRILAHIEIVEVEKIIPQKSMCNHTVEQMVDVAALQFQGTVDGTMSIPQGRTSAHIEIVEVLEIVPQKPVCNHTVEEIEDLPVLQFQGIVDGTMSLPQGRTSDRILAHIEIVEVLMVSLCESGFGAVIRNWCYLAVREDSRNFCTFARVLEVRP